MNLKDILDQSPVVYSAHDGDFFFQMSDVPEVIRLAKPRSEFQNVPEFAQLEERDNDGILRNSVSLVIGKRIGEITVQYSASSQYFLPETPVPDILVFSFAGGDFLVYKDGLYSNSPKDIFERCDTYAKCRILQKTNHRTLKSRKSLW